MIKLLHNPKTRDYCDFKRWVLSPEFAWNYNKASTPDIKNSTYTDLPHYTHTFLGRPETDFYSKIYNPDELHGVVQILKHILDCNEVSMNNFVRIAVNAVHPEKEIKSSIPHLDHQFPHGNIVIYLDDSGGSTFVEGEEYSPEEDDVIVFTGEHYMQSPAENRRVILVATMV
tara:strand:- start:194 stop:709 length:516 start_codon:yes stop_codon:yes gene_type:complete